MMNKQEAQISPFKFANICLKALKIKDTKYLWIGFIQVQNYLTNSNN